MLSQDSLLETRQQLEHDNQVLVSQLTELTYDTPSGDLPVLRMHTEVSSTMLVRAVAMYSAQREAEMPAILALETENQQHNAAIAELNKQHAQLREECEKVKAGAQECSDKIANDKFQLLNLKQDNDKLKTQIVKSPQRLKRVCVSASTLIITCHYVMMQAVSAMLQC